MKCIFCHQKTKKSRISSEETYCWSCDVSYMIAANEITDIGFYIPLMYKEGTYSLFFRSKITIHLIDNKIEYYNHHDHDSKKDQVLFIDGLDWIFPQNYMQKFDAWQKLVIFS